VAFDAAGTREQRVSPEDAGLERAAPEALECADVEESVAIAREVLDGARGARRDAVVLNAAAALAAAGRAPDLRAGAAQAQAALDEGRAKRLLLRVTELLGA
jgi:anthranilate phosphoribosyltransferase